MKKETISTGFQITGELDQCLKNAKLLEFESIKEASNSKWLILGGTGFVGKWITIAALELASRSGGGIEVIVASRDKYKAEKMFRRFVPERLKQPKIIDYNEVLKKQDHSSSIDEIDTVFHAATPTHNQDKSIFELPELTKKILDKCSEWNRPKFIHLSSGGVYPRGNFKGNLVPEGASRVNPSNAVNAYQQIKVQLECQVEEADKAGIVRGANPRLFAFAGPGFPLEREFAFADFFRSGLAKKSLIIRGNPQSRRSYMHPVDMVNWILMVWSHIDSIGLNPVHIGSHVPISMIELANQIADFFGESEVKTLNPVVAVEEWYVPETLMMRSLGCELRFSSLQNILESWSRYLAPKSSAWE